MNFDTVLTLLSIFSMISGAFHFLVIKPLRDAINALNASVASLQRSISESERDRRHMDARIATLEEGHKINKERITHLEDAWNNFRNT